MKQQEKCVVLPDVLEAGLKVVFCGTAAGDQSARRGAYYAGPGNRFWNILADTGLTPHRFTPEEYPSLVEFKIGLTDLVKGRSGQDVQLSGRDFDVSGFREKIEKYAPIVLPSTSGAARGFWNPKYWFQVAGFVER